MARENGITDIPIEQGSNYLEWRDSEGNIVYLKRTDKGVEYAAYIKKGWFSRDKKTLRLETS